VALVGVFEVPRIKLRHGVFRTKQKSTSVPTAANYMTGTQRWKTVSCRRGSAERPVGNLDLLRGAEPIEVEPEPDLKPNYFPAQN